VHAVVVPEMHDAYLESLVSNPMSSMESTPAVAICDRQCPGDRIEELHELFMVVRRHQSTTTVARSNDAAAFVVPLVNDCGQECARGP
jgi:hypothetical protein